MSKKQVARLTNYAWNVIPQPVLQCSELTKGEVVIYSTLYTIETRLHWRWTTVSEVARRSNCKRDRVKLALKHFAELGLIEYRTGPKGLTCRILEPDWLFTEERDRYLIRYEGFETEEVDLSFDKSTRLSNDNTESDTESEGAPPRGIMRKKLPAPSRGRGVPRHGAGHAPSRGTYKVDKKESEEGERAVAQSATALLEPGGPGFSTGKEGSRVLPFSKLMFPSRDHFPPGDDDEVLEEPNPDGGSREAEQALDRAERRRREGHAKRAAAPKRKRRAPSGPEFRDRPSERWEWTSWRNKQDGSWSGNDLVGYWVCRYREVVGAEDPAFTRDAVSFCDGVSKNVRLYRETHLPSVQAYRDAVDLILSNRDCLLAEAKPVSLTYYLGKPSNPGTWRDVEKRLRDPRSSRLRGGRRLSPIEVDDLTGGDKAAWDRQFEISRKRLEEAERREKELSVG